jgi:hypothetical protein
MRLPENINISGKPQICTSRQSLNPCGDLEIQSGPQMLPIKTRPFFVTSFCMVALYGQGGGGVQFRDWTVPTPSSKPVLACAELRSLTNFDYSVVSANMISGSAGVPSIVE